MSNKLLSELLQGVEPAPDSLVEIWSKIGVVTLEAERDRLHERFLEMAGRVVSINAILEAVEPTE